MPIKDEPLPPIAEDPILAGPVNLRWLSECKPYSENSGPPDWRYQSALRIIRNANRPRNDEKVRRLVLFIAKLAEVRSEDQGRQLWLSEPALCQAWQWSRSTEPGPRWHIEACACAGMSTDEIAGYTRCDPRAVDVFLQAFFDVRHYLPYPSALITKVIGPLLSIESPPHTWFPKLIAIRGGRRMLEVALQGPGCDPSPDLQDMFAGMYRTGLGMRSACAARGPYC
jgi:hypothetical protein